MLYPDFVSSNPKLPSKNSSLLCSTPSNEIKPSIQPAVNTYAQSDLSSLHTTTAKTAPSATANLPIPPEGPTTLAPPLPGSSLATVAVAPAVSTEQLAVPQPYPLGQQPALGPASVGHRNQPAAHVPVPVVVVAAPLAGTATVTPAPSVAETTVVDDAAGGQEVVWQSRPVWQQPPE